MTFKVFVDDNFRRMVEAERYELEEFPTAEAAIEATKRIVNRYLASTFRKGMSAEALYDSYTSFGEDPFIVSTGGGKHEFSAWRYAKKRCEEICKLGGA